MRYERKYRITNTHLGLIHQILRNHPASLRKIYPDRQINNVYWDSIGLQTYKDNVMGIAERQKFRIRWYGENVLEIKNPKLEIKKRINELGSKEIFDLPDFRLPEINSLSLTIEQLTRVNTNLIPILLGSYQRSYWGTFDKKFRLTVDHNIQFHSLLNEGTFKHYVHHDDAVILEVKYDEEWDALADRIIQYLPFRRTKNSKYVIGVEYSNTWLGIQ